MYNLLPLMLQSIVSLTVDYISTPGWIQICALVLFSDDLVFLTQIRIERESKIVFIVY